MHVERVGSALLTSGIILRLQLLADYLGLVSSVCMVFLHKLVVTLKWNRHEILVVVNPIGSIK